MENDRNSIENDSKLIENGKQVSSKLDGSGKGAQLETAPKNRTLGLNS